ncbi:TonB-dependent receptor [Geothrix fermentans]|uniref:TonB-dependent receptor n=1 Tax=Geothrix fermentans TaxID=44676 RepID=UPI00042A708A|nr:carboxypeptidase regulatory-like domain-containing protein [Geothrix fermentans]
MYLSPSRMARTTALLVAMGASLHAAGDGGITVTVTSTTGAIVAGATVTISSPTQIGGARTEVTDREGKARFLRLTPGRFKVVVTAKEFQTATIDKVDVLVDQTQGVNARLAPVGAAVVEVVSTVSAVDVTTVTAGTQLTQEELTNLPVVRSQLATLNLAPGVISVGGNPSLAAGLNRDNFGNNGARNNTYMIDGIDVTSPEAGTYRTTIAPELVAAQDIKTGAITAEYTARAGLFSNTTTISGSNDWSGGLNYYYRGSDWWNQVGRGRPAVVNSEVKDTTLYFSGPILKDRLWIVASGQTVKESGKIDVHPTATLTPGETRESVLNDEQRYFVKLTWNPIQGHTFVGGFSRNPGKFDNLNNPRTPTSQANQTERGGNNYNLSYTWQESKFILDARFLRHEEVDTTQALYPNLGAQVTVQTDPIAGSVPTIQRLFGGSSAGTKRKYQVDNGRVDFTYLFDALGSHTLKLGVQKGKSELTQTIFISNGAWYENLGPVGNVAGGPAPTFDYVDKNYSGFVPGTGSRMLTAINSGAYPTVRTALDTNSDGVVSLAELGAYQFTELYDPARPYMGYMGYRRNLASQATSSPRLETQGGYIQDQWQIGTWTFSPGVRFDTYEYKADNGQSLFKTGVNWAPRLGLTWDVKGNGRSKAYAYFGRYIDPIKLDMVRFTGSLSSSVQTEDIRLAGVWVTENTRGGSKTVDAVFADTFKLPKTDEFRLGFAQDFGNAWSAEATYTYRRDYDIVEDWDPTLYTDVNALEAEARSVFKLGTGAYSTLSASGQAVIDAYRALVIDPNYFAGGGYSGAQNVDRVAKGKLNFVLANLPGGFRYYNTFDFTVTRKLQDHWGGFATYTKVRATGNSNSSGNADYQGDLARFDPRLPYNNGSLEGSVDWLAKANLYYKWDSGVTLGATYNVVSGYHYSPSQAFSSRLLLKVPSDPTLLNTEMLGTNMSPRYDTMDVHLQYDFKLWKRLKGSVYTDVFNFFNKQQATDIAAVSNFVGSGYLTQGQAYGYVLPRRFNLGVKIAF